jgi:hypothetical protein
MLDYAVFIATGIAALRAYTYGRWLKANNNRIGAAGVTILAAGGIAVSIYRVLSIK